ncbi:MAG TPA: LLM class F420-dependent oxidoreductase [Acidimicrobiales bacterium]|nr:LLM class F420-dependent oxidoreductase [Acidimicrobiales bacterium]
MSLAVAVELPTMRVDPPSEFCTAEAVAEVARAAEDAGYSACFVTDHPAGDATWLDTGGHHALDPLVALSFAAAATTRLKLLTHVLVVPYRNPFLTAKATLTLDVLSGGRLIIGAAAGYLRPEFGALGVDFNERNELMDEALDVMRMAWSGEDVAYQGRHFKARAVRMRPLPASKTGPPIWIGGNSRTAIRRAVDRGDGWAPFPSAGIAKAAKTAELSGLDDLLERIDYLRSYAASVGRTAPLDICWSMGDVRQRSDLAALEAAGITWGTVGFPNADRAGYITALREWAARVL